MKRRVLSTLICIVMIAAILSACFLLNGCGKNGDDIVTYDYVSDGETDISIGVLADIHVMAEAQAVNMTCTDFKAWEAHGQKMLGLSESILKTAVDRIINESDFDVVLVSGDNADDGGEVTHRAVATELKRLENAGIKVFTIPGNHDINNHSYTYASGSAQRTNPTTEVEFAEIYADFGYNGEGGIEYYKNVGEDDPSDAHFSEGDNLSYVADLSDGYRLIAIDMCNYVATGIDEEGYPTVKGRHDGAMTEDLLLWVQSKTEEAVAAGKTPIGMMHFPLIQHFGSLVQAENGAVNDPDGYSVADVLADAGMRYIFTGHIHIQDDAIYTSENGNMILDINSASLCNYPTPVRYFRIKGNQSFVRTWNMDAIDAKYLPAYLSASEKEEILSDFTGYSVRYINDSMLAKIKNKVDMDLIYTLLKKLGVKQNGTNDSEVQALAESLYNDVFLKFLNLPLYKKDADGGISVESIAKSYGQKLPSSRYTSVMDLAMSYVVGVYGGDEQASADETRATLLKYSIYSALKLISDFDLFTKLHAFNEKVTAISLENAVADLFKTGKFDVCENGLLECVLNSLDISALKKLNLSGDSYDILDAAKNLVGTLGLEEMLFGLDVTKYITVNKRAKIGFINLGAIYDENAFGKLTLGLMNDSLAEGSKYDYLNGETDSAPADNNLTLTLSADKKTLAYNALK